jgi:AcrR family transcriptional regulator
MGKQPAVEGPDLRERIVQASVQLLEERGLAALSMREVARRAGVSHQAPYHHFQDREAILGAIAEEGFRMLCEAFERAVNQADLPLHERVATGGRAYIEFALAHPAHFRVMFRPELVNLEHCPGAQAEGDRAFALLRRFVDDAVAAGLPAVPSKEALLLLFWSVAHGFACLALDGPLALKTPDAERAQQIHEVTNALGTLVQGVGARS